MSEHGLRNFRTDSSEPYQAAMSRWLGVPCWQLESVVRSEDRQVRSLHRGRQLSDQRLSTH